MSAFISTNMLHWKMLRQVIVSLNLIEGSNMKNVKSGFPIVLLLVLLSLALYLVQLYVFRSPRDTFFYVLQDIAFLPVQIALVTVVLGRYLKNREKTDKLKKISMVINAFFSEAGTDVLKKLAGFSGNFEEVRPNLDVQLDWSDKNFSKTIRYLANVDFQIKCNPDELESLKELLRNMRDFLIRMLENPNLLEHDTFTDMLLAVFHLTEELIARDEFKDENAMDMAHLSIDIQRALRTLLIQWVSFMKHLRTEYPYLYSLEVRRNPFCKDNCITIKK